MWLSINEEYKHVILELKDGKIVSHLSGTPLEKFKCIPINPKCLPTEEEPLITCLCKPTEEEKKEDTVGNLIVWGEVILILIMLILIFLVTIVIEDRKKSRRK